MKIKFSGRESSVERLVVSEKEDRTCHFEEVNERSRGPNTKDHCKKGVCLRSHLRKGWYSPEKNSGRPRKNSGSVYKREGKSRMTKWVGTQELWVRESRGPGDRGSQRIREYPRGRRRIDH